MTYSIELEKNIADVFLGLDANDLSNALSDKELMAKFSYALSKFQNACEVAMDNGDYVLSAEESEQSYNFHADICN